MLIGLTGKAGSGKSTCAEALVSQMRTSYDPLFVEVSLGAPVKEVAREIWGFSTEQLYGPSECRNAPDHRWPMGDGSTYLTPRLALQRLGTDCVRALTPDAWTRRAIEDAKVYMDGGYHVVISDVRFDNEAAAIREAGGVVIHISRSGVAEPARGYKQLCARESWRQHTSEAGVEPRLGDRHLHNTGTKEEAQEAIRELVGALIRGRE